MNIKDAKTSHAPLDHEHCALVVFIQVIIFNQNENFCF